MSKLTGARLRAAAPVDVSPPDGALVVALAGVMASCWGSVLEIGRLDSSGIVLPVSDFLFL